MFMIIQVYCLDDKVYVYGQDYVLQTVLTDFSSTFWSVSMNNTLKIFCEFINKLIDIF